MQWTRFLPIASLLVLLCPRTVTAVPFTIDQVNDFVGPGQFSSVLLNRPVGQEFIPDLPSLDVVELFFGVPAPVLGGDFLVNIRESTIAGPILGTSGIVSLPSTAGHFENFVRFDFGSPVILVPGSPYLIEVVHLLGGNWGVFFNNEDTYSAGRGVREGVLLANSDLSFREGTTAVPESSPLVLVAIGLVGLFGIRWTCSPKTYQSAFAGSRTA